MLQTVVDKTAFYISGVPGHTDAPSLYACRCPVIVRMRSVIGVWPYCAYTLDPSVLLPSACALVTQGGRVYPVVDGSDFLLTTRPIIMARLLHSHARTHTHTHTVCVCQPATSTYSRPCETRRSRKPNIQTGTIWGTHRQLSWVSPEWKHWARGSRSCVAFEP